MHYWHVQITFRWTHTWKCLYFAPEIKTASNILPWGRCWISWINSWQWLLGKVDESAVGKEKMFSTCDNICWVEFLDSFGLGSSRLRESILSASSLDVFFSFLLRATHKSNGNIQRLNTICNNMKTKLSHELLHVERVRKSILIQFEISCFFRCVDVYTVLVKGKSWYTQHHILCAYLRQLAKCLIVRWRLVMPKDWTCSIAVVMGSCCPMVRARRAQRVV